MLLSALVWFGRTFAPAIAEVIWDNLLRERLKENEKTRWMVGVGDSILLASYFSWFNSIAGRILKGKMKEKVFNIGMAGLAGMGIWGRAQGLTETALEILRKKEQEEIAKKMTGGKEKIEVEELQKLLQEDLTDELVSRNVLEGENYLHELEQLELLLEEESELYLQQLSILIDELFAEEEGY